MIHKLDIKVILQVVIITSIFLCLVYSAKAQTRGNIDLEFKQFKDFMIEQNIDENDLKNRLREKGLEIENLDEQTLMKNQFLILETINEINNQQNRRNAKYVSDSAYLDYQNLRTNISNSPNDSSKIVLKGQKKLKDTSLEANTPSNSSRIFGHQFFSDNSIEIFNTSTDLTATESYILGPGDKINVLIFGKSQADLNFEITPSGFIQPNQMPKIFLSGLTLLQAKEMLELKFSSQYIFNKGQFAVTIQATRNIAVHIFGEVKKAGTYRLGAFNSAWAALMAAGGPTELGSVRNIRLIRGTTIKILDIYEYLSQPSGTFDFALQSNDIIIVPVSESIVVAEGSVKRPMAYEMKSGEGLNELISFAGGLEANASLKWAQVKRMGDINSEIFDIPLDSILTSRHKYALFNRDTVRFKPISTILRNSVVINGAVYFPGTYDLKMNTNIVELLSKAIVRPEAKTDQVFILRKNTNGILETFSANIDEIIEGKQKNFQLLNEDEVWVYEQSRYVDQFPIQVIGEVRSPLNMKFSYNKGLSVISAIQLSGGLKASAAQIGYILRTDPYTKLKTEYIPIEISDDSKDSLKAGDLLVILNKDSFLHEFPVTIAGEVSVPQTLRYDRSLTIMDLVRLSGGFTFSCDSSSVEVYRLEFGRSLSPKKVNFNISLDSNFNPIDKTFALMPFDIVVFRRLPDFYLHEMVTVEGEVIRPGPYVLKNRRIFFSDLIKNSGGVTSEGDIKNAFIIRSGNNRITNTNKNQTQFQVFFDGKKAIRYSKKSAHDPIILNNDRIIVPRKDNSVRILTKGTNYNSMSSSDTLYFTYQGHKSAKKYINKNAGGAIKSDSLAIRYKVSHLNGMQESSQLVWPFSRHPKILSGDIIEIVHIHVPKKGDNEAKLDWNNLSAKLLALLTAVAILRGTL